MGVTTVDIDRELLAEAKEVLGTTTTKATLDRALREVLGRRRQREAVLGILDLDLDPHPQKIDYPDDLDV